MLKKKEYKFWFCTGSQDLYGDECLAHVAEHAKIIVEKLNESRVLPYEVVWKPTLITNELIRKTFNEANIDDECAGVITWMHTQDSELREKLLLDTGQTRRSRRRSLPGCVQQLV